jgi:hypothetical protein
MMLSALLRKVYNDPPNGERVHARRYVDRDPLGMWNACDKIRF